MISKTLVAAGLLSAFTVAPAMALTITNVDPQAHTLTVVENGVTETLTLGPSEFREGLCRTTCSIQVGDTAPDGVTYEPTDIVSIEDGEIYLDGSLTELTDDVIGSDDFSDGTQQQ